MGWGGHINYSLNGPAVGATFPLTIDGANVPAATVSSQGTVSTTAQTFAGVKTFSSGVEFTSASLSDEQATRMGLKQYLHGTTYNGGIAPTVGSFSSVIRGDFVPYQTQDGTWRLKFNIAGTVASASRSNFTCSVNGILFKNIGGFFQTGNGASSGVATWVTMAPNSSTIGWDHATATTVAYYASADVELNSKPTWAY